MMFPHSQCGPECKSLAWQSVESGCHCSLGWIIGRNIQLKLLHLSLVKSLTQLWHPNIFSASCELWDPGPHAGEISNNIMMILEQFSHRVRETFLWRNDPAGFLPAPLVSNCLMRNNKTCCWVSSGLVQAGHKKWITTSKYDGNNRKPISWPVSPTSFQS